LEYISSNHVFTLIVKYENGFKLPQWAKSVYPDQLAPIYAKVFETVIAGTPTMTRLSAGK
jgi:hypothetical protein